MINPFFKNCGPLKLKDIYNILKIKKENNNKKTQIFDITDLNSASPPRVPCELVSSKF